MSTTVASEAARIHGLRDGFYDLDPPAGLNPAIADTYNEARTDGARERASVADERLTRNQFGALDAVGQHGHLDAGWGGYSMATMRSLERRGFLSTSIVDGKRFSLTQRGHEAIRVRDMREHPEWFAEVTP